MTWYVYIEAGIKEAAAQVLSKPSHHEIVTVGTSEVCYFADCILNVVFGIFFSHQVPNCDMLHSIFNRILWRNFRSSVRRDCYENFQFTLCICMLRFYALIYIKCFSAFFLTFCLLKSLISPDKILAQFPRWWQMPWPMKVSFCTYIFGSIVQSLIILEDISSFWFFQATLRWRRSRRRQLRRRS